MANRFDFCIWLSGEGDNVTEAWDDALNRLVMPGGEPSMPQFLVGKEAPVDGDEVLATRTSIGFDCGPVESAPLILCPHENNPLTCYLCCGEQGGPFGV